MDSGTAAMIALARKAVEDAKRAIEAGSAGLKRAREANAEAGEALKKKPITKPDVPPK